MVLEGQESPAEVSQPIGRDLGRKRSKAEVVGSCIEEGQEDGEFFDPATMRRRPSNLLVKSMSLGSESRRSTVGYLGPHLVPFWIALVVAAYFVMMCCGLSTGTQRASGILGVWDFPSWPNIVLAFMHSPSVE